LFYLNPRNSTQRSLFMKRNSMLLWGMLVMLLATAFTITGCTPDPDDGPAVEEFTGYAGNVLYKLIITTPKDGGATYVLNITPGGKKSTGAVTGKSNGVYTLKPSNGEAFTVTTSGAGISAMSGTITFTDEATETAPTTLSPPQSGGAGYFKVTGIPSKYEGKYAWAQAYLETKDNALLVGCQSFDPTGNTMSATKIIDGSVQLPLITVFPSPRTDMFAYTGDNTVSELELYVVSNQTFPTDETEPTVEERKFTMVQFTGGQATKTWDQGTAP
jgi:hypothetical protein